MTVSLIGHRKWVLSTKPNLEQNANINATVVFYGKADTLYDLSLYHVTDKFSNNWLVTWPFLLVLHIGHPTTLLCKDFQEFKTNICLLPLHSLLHRSNSLPRIEPDPFSNLLILAWMHR